MKWEGVAVQKKSDLRVLDVLFELKLSWAVISLVEGVGKVIEELLKLEPALTAAQLLREEAPRYEE